MNGLLKLIRKNPMLAIGTVAVVGLALGTGAIPLPFPSLQMRQAAPSTTAKPAVPPPPPDPIDAY